MGRKILAMLTILLGATSSIAYLYYAPSHLILSITDPPATPYSNNITAIYLTLTTIEIHAANADNNSGWHTIATDVTLNLMTLLSTSKLLGTAQLPPGRNQPIKSSPIQP